MGSIEGRVAIVTGGASGIGRATVVRLLADGARVAVWDKEAPAGLGDAAAVPADRLLVEEVDIRRPALVQQATETLIASTGRIDILVNAAGLTVGHKPTPDLPVGVWKAILDTNLSGAFHCVQAVVPHMTARHWGRIVNLTSVVAEFGYPGHAAYVASKSGLAGATRSWAREFGRFGITVNAVRPGYIKTPMNDRNPPELEAQIAAMTPLGRIGQPDDVAGAIAWLCSTDAGFVTGAVIAVDGGLIT